MFNIALVLYGWDNEEIMSMSTVRYRERIKSLDLPPHIVVINYLGLSLTCSLGILSTY